MKKNFKTRVKGFTLIELVIVLAIVGVLSMILVPTLVGYVEKARILAAVADARTIKTTVESSLLEQFQFSSASTENYTKAFNKILYLDQSRKESEREKESVGAFTNVSWYTYKKKENAGSSQAVDKVIAAGLDAKFSESWQTGKKTNPLSYNSTTRNCEKYLKENNTNFGLIIVYNMDFSVRMMQLYRKGVLVTYLNGEYIVNTNRDAHFIGESVWSTIYTDTGKTSTGDCYKINLKKGQVKDDGTVGSWY